MSAFTRSDACTGLMCVFDHADMTTQMTINTVIVSLGGQQKQCTLLTYSNLYELSCVTQQSAHAVFAACMARTVARRYNQCFVFADAGGSGNSHAIREAFAWAANTLTSLAEQQDSYVTAKSESTIKLCIKVIRDVAYRYSCRYGDPTPAQTVIDCLCVWNNLHHLTIRPYPSCASKDSEGMFEYFIREAVVRGNIDAVTALLPGYIQPHTLVREACAGGCPASIAFACHETRKPGTPFYEDLDVASLHQVMLGYAERGNELEGIPVLYAVARLQQSHSPFDTAAKLAARRGSLCLMRHALCCFVRAPLSTHDVTPCRHCIMGGAHVDAAFHIDHDRLIMHGPLLFELLYIACDTANDDCSRWLLNTIQCVIDTHGYIHNQFFVLMRRVVRLLLISDDYVFHRAASDSQHHLCGHASDGRAAINVLSQYGYIRYAWIQHTAWHTRDDLVLYAQSLFDESKQQFACDERDTDGDNRRDITWMYAPDSTRLIPPSWFLPPKPISLYDTCNPMEAAPIEIKTNNGCDRWHLYYDAVRA